MKALIITTSIVLFFCFPCSSLSATFTVCSSGCNSKNISDIFSEYDLSGGDIVEVRADTVGGSKVYYETIKPEADDMGSSGKPLIVKARKGDKVTISGSTHGVDTRTNGVYYITIEGFNFTNTDSYIMYLGENGSLQKSYPIAEEITIQNCTILGHKNQGIFLNRGSNCMIKNNTITSYDGSIPEQSDGIVLYRGANNILDGNTIVIKNDSDSPHVDCAQTAWEDNLTVRNNYFEQNNTSGANKQFVITQVNSGYVALYNNIFYKATGNTNSNAISISGGDADIYVLNNSLLINGCASGIMNRNTGLLHIQNNAIKINASVTGIYLDGGTQTKTNIHHNVIWTAQKSQLFWRDNNGYHDLLAWQSLGGGNGSNAQNFSLDHNFHPDVNSVLLVDVGVEQDLFNSDKDGVVRLSGEWDIGAYEAIGASTGLEPKNLRID